MLDFDMPLEDFTAKAGRWNFDEEASYHCFLSNEKCETDALLMAS